MSGFALESPEPDENGAGNRGRWGRQLACYVDTLTATFLRDGMTPERATELAERATLDLAMVQGGGRVYLPTGDRLRKAVRNRRIFLEWRGDNAVALMRKYRINTGRRLEQIIAEETAILHNKMQPDFSAVDPSFKKPGPTR